MNGPLLLVTRPIEESGRTIEAAEKAGFSVQLAPLLETEPLDWTVPAEWPEALLFTSARAPGLVAERAPELTRVPVYAVGPRTADAAIAAGFRVVAAGAADGTAAVALAAAQGVRRLLHPGGEDRAPIDLPPGVLLSHLPVYAARRVAALSDAAVTLLQQGLVFATLLFSPRTARHFVRLAEAAGLARADLRLVAISATAAEAAGPGWRAVAIADSPDLPGVLAAAAALWQGRTDG